MIRFGNPLMLWLLLLVPVWIGLFWYMLHARKISAARFISSGLLQHVAYSISRRRLTTKAVFWILAWTLLVIGASNPQVGTKYEEVKREGIDVVIALDLSYSMLCEDIPPSRLESAKHEILKFVNGLGGDRVGLVAFAGTAINHCPLTTDYNAVKLLVRVMNPQLLPEPGTALADAIRAASRSFNDEEAKSKVLIIITDGEDHEEEAVEAATEAYEKGIRIYTIGMGTPQGAPIPEYSERGSSSSFKRDKTNEIIVTRLNEILLQRVANAADGRYLRGSIGAGELETLWEDISQMEKRELGQKQYSAFEDRFMYFVIPGFLFLLIEFFISERRGRLRLLTLFTAAGVKEKTS
ncbi:VWA domain-containing protein [bacterium]|nr:VWA domain-containing protein [bacterium]MBU1920623.1 VWA domain-containing protein [bacterium]